MMSKMKKWAACLLAVLMVIQMVPVVAEETVITSGTQGPITSYRDKLEISGDSSIILEGATLQLTATEGYNSLIWSSSDESIATVDKDGLVTAIAAGTVKITAQEGADYADSIKIVVVAKPVAEQTESEDNDEEIAEEDMIIVIAVNKDKITYDGQPHTLGYTATSNREDFDAEKVAIKDESALITETNGGVYRSNYEAAGFTYDGDENVEFVVSEGWLQIKSANVTVKANDLTIGEGDTPEFTATVTGLAEGDDPSLIQYTFEVIVDGDINYIMPVCEQTQGNYRVTAQAGILTTEGTRYTNIHVSSDWPEGQPAYVGTPITMTAELTGFDGLEYTLQWQYSKDLQEWTDVPGANGLTYTFELNEETVQYTWRVIANYK